ncbi:hypothetical protein BDZ91DRAFT_731625 [Kalaharituber pfeilii]|nr:hypothetical protein BDZ91DRAFT_731625 [Kalaharituber pfeilii]
MSVGGLVHSVSGLFSPCGRRRTEIAHNRDDHTPDYLSDIDANLGLYAALPNDFWENSDGEPTGSRYVGPPYPPRTESSSCAFYPSRIRLWCCQCLHLATARETFSRDAMNTYRAAAPTNLDSARPANFEPGALAEGADPGLYGYEGFECTWCAGHLPVTHRYCSNCALVRINEIQLPKGTRWAFSSEALEVARHPIFTAGGIGVHGPLFYLVECCKPYCAGVYRIDWQDVDEVQDTKGPLYEDGLLTDFTEFRCPECGGYACRNCIKMVVATQVIVGGLSSHGWVEEGESVRQLAPRPSERTPHLLRRLAAIDRDKLAAEETEARDDALSLMEIEIRREVLRLSMELEEGVQEAEITTPQPPKRPRGPAQYRPAEGAYVPNRAAGDWDRPLTMARMEAQARGERDVTGISPPEAV